MRQRRLKDLDKRLEQYEEYIIKDVKKNKGSWNKIFKNENPIFLEIGCGKGQFITSLALKNPEKNYIAIEGQESVIVKVAEKLEEKSLKNVILISEYVVDIKDYFKENEIEGIYLNFSDPWPKARHAKRRLTYRNFLESYSHIIKDQGCIEFKTDNDDLYDFTLEEIESLEYKVLEQTRDLHKSSFTSKNTKTEYEEKFSSRGKNINYVKIKIGG